MPKGILKLIEVQEITSPVADIKFLNFGPPNFDYYLLQWIGVTCGTTNQQLIAHITNDGGATWEEGAAYGYGGRGLQSSGSATSSNSANETEIRASHGGNIDTLGFSGEMVLFDPTGITAGQTTTVMTIGMSSSTVVDVVTEWESSSGVDETAGGGPYDGIRFKFFVGNIDTGRFRLYGVDR